MVNQTARLIGCSPERELREIASAPVPELTLRATTSGAMRRWLMSVALVAAAASISSAQAPAPFAISGIYPHLAFFNSQGECGVGGVVPMDDGVLARELDRWFKDDRLRKSAADAAPAFARERYDCQAIAQRWVGHYQTVVKQPR